MLHAWYVVCMVIDNIRGYYIGLGKYINYFRTNMVLESMNYGGTINSYYRTVLE